MYTNNSFTLLSKNCLVATLLLARTRVLIPEALDLLHKLFLDPAPEQRILRYVVAEEDYESGLDGCLCL